MQIWVDNEIAWFVHIHMKYTEQKKKAHKKRQAEWNWIKQQVKSISYVLYAPMVIAELQYTF